MLRVSLPILRLPNSLSENFSSWFGDMFEKIWILMKFYCLGKSTSQRIYPKPHTA